MNRKKIEQILNDSEKLVKLAEEFTGNWRIVIEDGILYEQVNTACNCHPEYNNKAINLDDMVEYFKK